MLQSTDGWWMDESMILGNSSPGKFSGHYRPLTKLPALTNRWTTSWFMVIFRCRARGWAICNLIHTPKVSFWKFSSFREPQGYNFHPSASPKRYQFGNKHLFLVITYIYNWMQEKTKLLFLNDKQLSKYLIESRIIQWWYSVIDILIVTDCIHLKTFAFLAVYWSIWTSLYNTDIKAQHFVLNRASTMLNNVFKCN